MHQQNMGCPYSTEFKPPAITLNSEKVVKVTDTGSESSLSNGCQSNGISKIKSVDLENRRTYNDYLMLGQLLDCQQMLSSGESTVHDEHLFIVTHQTYELWFKQMIYELDSIRQLFLNKVVDERDTLIIISRLNRLTVILKLLVDQFAVIETMTPSDFLEFRKYLQDGSGFQSLQFRLIENKLGLNKDQRIDYNQQNYRKVFNKTDDQTRIHTSLDDLSLVELVIKWLERTPGLDPAEFGFWERYKNAVFTWLRDEYEEPAKKEKDPEVVKAKLVTYEKQKTIFENILYEDNYEESRLRGERRFSHRAFQGALMILLYRDEPRFHQPFQILTLLMDIDSLMTKWRYNHVAMVQRMIGSKIGTGGSSGYHYLRATISDRYKIFLDLFNMATYLIPRQLIPPLNLRMKRALSIVSNDGIEPLIERINLKNADDQWLN